MKLNKLFAVLIMLSMMAVIFAHPAADIKATFGISKGQFKKALGGLMKAKKVKQDQFGTELIG